MNLDKVANNILYVWYVFFFFFLIIYIFNCGRVQKLGRGVAVSEHGKGFPCEVHVVAGMGLDIC